MALFYRVIHNNRPLTIALYTFLLPQIHDFRPCGLIVIYIHLLHWPSLLLNVPLSLLEEMLKVIAAGVNADLGALAHVVDGLPYLIWPHPLG